MDVVGAFRERTGADPDGVWRAPGRVNLIGEHTDYNDGLVLPFAIDLAASVAVRRRSDRVARCWSLQKQDGPVELTLDDLEPGGLDGWAAYVLGVAWALREAAGSDAIAGFDLVLDSEVPAGGGLSSSAAVECATGLALVELCGVEADLTAIAEAGRRAENDVVGAPVGVMDQMASMWGQVDHAVFLDCRSLQVSHEPLDVATAGLALVVVDTRVAHANAGGGYASRRRACEAAARALGVGSLRDADLESVESRLSGELRKRARHVVTENARVAETVRVLRESGPAHIGRLLDASHASMRDDFEISVPELDSAVTAAKAAGALGARLTGGGFGGCVVALVPADATDTLSAQVVQAAAARHFPEPAVFTVQPSDGARRVQ